VIDASPDHWPTRLDRVQYALADGRPEDALEDIDRVIAAGPSDRLKSSFMQFARQAATQSVQSRGQTVLQIEQAIWWTGQVLKLDPLDRYAVVGRAHQYARLGQWPEAARDLSRAVELDPTEHWEWFRLAPVLQTLEDKKRYKEHCGQMLERFDESTGYLVSGRAIQSCLWSQDGVDDWNPIVELAEKHVLPSDGSPVDDPWRLCSAGIARYRNGQYESASEWLKKSLDAKSDSYCETRALPVLAMSYHHLGRDEEAQEALEHARRNFDEKLPKLENGDLGSKWHNWLICRILLSEAEDLIGEESAAEDVKNEETPPQ
jgi:tetratricopeptide (TPR) repeat protein